jgi:hypothetical protein
MKASERYKIGTSASGIGGFYCSIREYMTARNKRTGKPFTKFLRFISVGDNKPFPDRETALAAGRAKREALMARLHPVVPREVAAPDRQPEPETVFVGMCDAGGYTVMAISHDRKEAQRLVFTKWRETVYPGFQPEITTFDDLREWNGVTVQPVVVGKSFLWEMSK